MKSDDVKRMIVTIPIDKLSKKDAINKIKELMKEYSKKVDFAGFSDITKN
jgi:hypothetical protein